MIASRLCRHAKNGVIWKISDDMAEYTGAPQDKICKGICTFYLKTLDKPLRGPASGVCPLGPVRLCAGETRTTGEA